MNIENLLNEEIRYELEGLRDLTIGSKEHELAVGDLAKLMDRSIELEKLDIQDKENSKKREDAAFEQEFKLSQLKEERKAQNVKVCIDVAGIVLPCIVTIWGTLKSFEFEKEGTVTTIMGRGFINKLLPRK